jgi:hypothetical protein
MFTGCNGMARRRTRIGGVVAQVIVFLLLCGIVGGEFPELLSLIDNTSNDFTVRKTNSMVSSLPRDAGRYGRVSNVGPNIAAHDGTFSRFSPFEKAELVPSDVSILYSILRT